MPLLLRLWVPVWQSLSYLRAVSTMRRPSETLWLTGFSQYTSLPFCIAQMAASACQWFGVAMEMTSMSLSATTLRMSCS